MSKRVSYIYVNKSIDNSPSIYGHFRFFLCDTLNELPVSDVVNGDIAVILDVKKFLFSLNSQWNEVKGEKGDQGEPGNIKDAWPIDSIFTCAVDTSPEKLLGFGKWELVQKEPFFAWQRKD
jgi:hypothetical protein